MSSIEEILAQLDTEAMTRAEIRQVMRQIGKDELLDAEMKRLGFWDPDEISGTEGKLSDLKAERDALCVKLEELSQSLSGKEDAERRLAEEQQARIEASRQKQKDDRERREQERVARKEAWEKAQTEDILFLGETVSSGLNYTYESKKKQAYNQLPSIQTMKDLAHLLETDIPTLRVFGFFRPVSKFNHYHRFGIPKKTGGERKISAPLPRLKALQRSILDRILGQVPIHEAAHGFVPGRSVYTNAIPHVGKTIVVNMDLKDFFPTLTFKRVKGCFVHLGYSPKIATMLALLCTEANTIEAEMDGQKWFVAQGERFLPQGAPTSPCLTNIVCRRMDYRLEGLAKSLGCTYTRYADDVTFSSDDASLNVGKLLFMARKIVEAEGFVVHPKKTSIMRDGMRKEVTGVVVNEKTSVDRETLRNFRALLHQIELDGPEGKTWGDSEDVLTAALGFASFVQMVDPEHGAPLHAKVLELCQKHRN